MRNRGLLLGEYINLSLALTIGTMSVRYNPRPTPQVTQPILGGWGHKAAPAAPAEVNISLAYIVVRRGQYGTKETWALLIPSMFGDEIVSYPLIMQGDNWNGYEVLTSSPVKPGDKMVQRVLNSFFNGWGDALPKDANVLKSMGYAVP